MTQQVSLRDMIFMSGVAQSAQVKALALAMLDLLRHDEATKQYPPHLVTALRSAGERLLWSLDNQDARSPAVNPQSRSESAQGYREDLILE